MILMKNLRSRLSFSLPFYNKGNTLSDLRKYREAVVYTNKEIELEPNNPNNNFDVDFIKNMSLFNKNEEAIDSMNLSIKADSKDSRAYNNKGIALRNIQKHEEAIKYFEKAFSLEPNGLFLKNIQDALNDFEVNRYKNNLL